MEEVINNYKIIGELGKGSFGNVYKAKKDDKVYAMKIIDTEKFDKHIYPKLMELLNSEKMIMSTLNHKNIIKMYDSFEIGYKNYLILDYCDGGSLTNLIANNKEMDFKQKLNHVYEIVCGINELFTHQIMHRDIKLENIFIKDNKCIIGDLGFAKIGKQYTNTNLGTFLYMAPEILKNEDDYDFKVDVWAIGVLIYYLFYKNFPFFAYSGKDMIKQIFNFCEEKKYNNDNNLPTEIKELLNKTLVFNYKKRISISDLKLILEKYLNVFIKEEEIKKVQEEEEEKEKNEFENDFNNVEKTKLNVKLDLNLEEKKPLNIKFNNITYINFIYDLLIELKDIIIEKNYKNKNEEDIILFTLLIIYNYIKILVINFQNREEISNLKNNFQNFKINNFINKNYIQNYRNRLIKISQMEQNEDNYLKILKVCVKNLDKIEKNNIFKSQFILLTKLKLITNEEIILNVIKSNQWNKISNIIEKIKNKD